jgi:L-lactate dehydrogenase (cytochrome)
VLNDVGRVDASTTILGRPTSLPLILAPTGFTRIASAQGELDVARAAARAGLTYTLSSLATRSIEEVRSVSDGDLWFQVYVWTDKGLLSKMLERAQAAGYSTIVVTVDTAVLGRRERDIRRGFTLPPRIGLGTLLDGMMHPSWTWEFVRNEPIRFANLLDEGTSNGMEAVSLADFVTNQFDPSLNWSDIKWFRDRWPGNIVLKGIQTIEDAKLATEHGIKGIALSNHGGRQLDCAPPPLDLVAPVVDAVGDSLEVYCDGGVRRGSDVIKAVALGATAAMAGRAYLYGLAAAGERGVDHALDLLRDDIHRTLALIGSPSIGSMTRDLVTRHP